jgi:hypothetical protein
MIFSSTELWVNIAVVGDAISVWSCIYTDRKIAIEQRARQFEQFCKEYGLTKRAARGMMKTVTLSKLFEMKEM